MFLTFGGASERRARGTWAGIWPPGASSGLLGPPGPGSGFPSPPGLDFRLLGLLGWILAFWAPLGLLGLDSSLLAPPGVDSGFLGSPRALWGLLGWFALVLVCLFGHSTHLVRHFGPEPGPSLWTWDYRLIRSVTLALPFPPATSDLDPSFLDLVRHFGPPIPTWHFGSWSFIFGLGPSLWTFYSDLALWVSVRRFGLRPSLWSFVYDLVLYELVMGQSTCM